VSIVVVAILGVTWAAFLLYSCLAKRAEDQPATSIASFRNQIVTLERAAPSYRQGTKGLIGGQRYIPIAQSLARPSAFPAPSTRVDVRRRRRDVLLTLLGLDTLTLLMVVVGVGSVAMPMFLLTFGLTAGYVGLLVQAQRLASERERKVRTLPRQQRLVHPSLLESRSASS
jgi:hypothetical protein